jgi:hypothetical protein
MPHLPSSPSMVLQRFLVDSADYSTFSSNPTPPLCVASPLLFVIPSTPHLPLRRLLSPSDSHCKPEQQRTALLCGRRHETWRLRAGRHKKRGGEDSICSCCFHVSTQRDLFALTLQALLIVRHTCCFLFLSLPHSLSLSLSSPTSEWQRTTCWSRGRSSMRTGRTLQHTSAAPRERLR